MATGLASSTSEFDKLHDSSYGFPISLQCVLQQKWQHDFVPAFGSQAVGTATPGFGAQNMGGLVLQEVPSQTGEEKETPVFADDALLFEFLGSEWKELGRGEIRLNLPEGQEWS